MKYLTPLFQVAFSEIMQMIWKRLNDHGKNWRHVYKALVLLEYLIKTGSEKVGKVLVMPHSVYRQVLCHVQFSDKFYVTFSFERYACRWPSSARRTFLQSRPWRTSSLWRRTRIRDWMWERRPRPWCPCLRWHEVPPHHLLEVTDSCCANRMTID